MSTLSLKAENKHEIYAGLEAPEKTIDRFLDAIWMERGLSVNTLAAYRADILCLSRWLEEQDVTLSAASRSDLL
ncbi:MAG: site-specific integrase, partial [Gammaproteobacteria bacterium]